MIEELARYYIYWLPMLLTASPFLVLFLCKKTGRPAYRRPEVIALLLLLFSYLVLGAIASVWLVSLKVDGKAPDVFPPTYTALVILNIVVHRASQILLIVAFGLLARKQKSTASQSASEPAAGTFMPYQ